MAAGAEQECILLREWAVAITHATYSPGAAGATAGRAGQVERITRSAGDEADRVRNISSFGIDRSAGEAAAEGIKLNGRPGADGY